MQSVLSLTLRVRLYRTQRSRLRTSALKRVETLRRVPEENSRFNLLPVGEYKVRVKATGFKSAEIPTFALSVGDRRRVDVALSPGNRPK